jgi:putative transposase
MSRDLRPVYTAPSEVVARERFAEFDAKWGKQYPAISKLWGERLERVHTVLGLRR